MQFGVLQHPGLIPTAPKCPPLCSKKSFANTAFAPDGRHLRLATGL